MKLSPTHRYLAVRDLLDNNSPPPVDVVMAALYALLQNKPAPDDVAYAWDLFENEEFRANMDAFILTRSSPDLISKVLGIPQEVIETYAYLFMDMRALRNRLEVLAFVSTYEGNARGKEIVRTAITVGVDYLLWTHNAAPDMEPRSVIRKTMTDAFFRGLAHRGNSLSTTIAKEAHKWWGMAVSNAKLLEQMDPRATRAAYEELRIALEGHDDTLPVSAAPVSPSEMLH